jgi:N-acetylmuramoyl-L-alanine amidase
MNQNLFYTFLFLLFHLSLIGQERLIIPFNGSNVKKQEILEDYNLKKYSCSEFPPIVKTKNNKSYDLHLPILVFEYKSGVSIRATTKTDINTAIRISEYNKKLKKDGVKRKLFNEDNKLYVPIYFLNCKNVSEKKNIKENNPKVVSKSENNDLPKSKNPNTKYKTYPIFGKEHEDVPIVSSNLKGNVYYLISGHGGPDPGARTKASNGKILCEDEYAYDFTLRLAKLLVSNGGLVYIVNRDKNDGIRNGEYLTCDEDEITFGDKQIPVGQKQRLSQRCQTINKYYNQQKRNGAKKQILVEIHIDSRAVASRADVFFYYKPNDLKGEKLAQKVKNTLALKYKKYRSTGNYSGTAYARNLYTFRNALPTSLYIELGNLKNPLDQKRFVQASNRQLLAHWLYEGITAD